MLAGLSPEKKKSLGLTLAEKYFYLNQVNVLQYISTH